MGRWLFGGTASGSGAALENWTLNIAGGNAPKAIQATIRVTELDVGKSGNVFRFSRDGGTPVDAPYTDADDDVRYSP